MKHGSKKEQIEAELKAAEAYLQDSARLLVDEFSSVGSSIKKQATTNPWVGIGAALVGGWLVGRMFGKSAPAKLPPRLTGLVDDLVDDVTSAIENGIDPRRYVRRTLRAVEVPASSQPHDTDDSSLLGSVMSIGSRILISMAMQRGLVRLNEYLDKMDVPIDLPVDSDEATSSEL